MPKTRKVGKLRLKLHQDPRKLRDQARAWAAKASVAAENARALLALADEREREEQKALEKFYWDEHAKVCQDPECKKGGETASRHVGFMIGHLGRGSGMLAGDDLKRRGL